MNWMLPAVTSTLIATLILTYVYYYLYCEYKERFFKVWMISWVFYSIRFCLMLAFIETGKPPILFLLTIVFSIMSSVFLIWGTYLFVEKKLSEIWFLLGAFSIVWLLVVHLFSGSIALLTIVPFFFMGGVYIWTGGFILKHEALKTLSSKITGWCFIIWGLHKIDYPFVRSIEWLAPWGYLLGAALTLIIAVGMLIVYFQKMGGDLRNTNQFNQQVLESVQDGIVVYDRDLRYQVWNRQMEVQTGFAAEYVLGKHLLEVFPLLKDQGIMDQLERVLGGAEQSTIVISYKLPGTEKPSWYEDTTSAIRNSDGEIIGAIAVVREITERKQFEEDLRKSEEKYRLLIENQSTMVVKFDRDQKILFASPAYCQEFGKAEEELVDSSFISMIHEDDRERVAAEIGNVFFPPHVVLVEERAYTVHGWRWQEWSNKAEFNENGEITSIVAVGRDITERKNAEEELNANRTHLSNSLLLAKLGHWEYDIASDTFTFTDEFYNIFRTTAQEVGGYTMKSSAYAERFVHPDDRYIVAQEVRGAATAKTPGYSRTVEHRIIYADGEIGYIAVRFVLIMDAHGRPIKTIGVNQDITERKKAEAALAESEATLKKAQRVAQFGSWKFDLNTGMVQTSEEARTVYGLGDDEWTIEKVKTLPLSRYWDMLDAKMEKLMSGEGTYDAEFQIRRPLDGEIRDIHSVAEYDPENNTIIGTIQDVTDIKQQQEEMKLMQAQLTQSQKMEAIGHLAGGVAHDFNNMLGVIMGSAQLAMSDLEPDTEPFKEQQVIIETSKRARSLTSKLLTFARKEEPTLKPASINDLILDITLMLQRSIPKTIKVFTDLDPDILPIDVDKNQMRQAFLNICNNAADAMPAGGILKIKTLKGRVGDPECGIESDECGCSCCSIEISDSGTGIPEIIRDQIFDPFFTTKGVGKGTGLGLSVTHGIIKSHGGSISVASESNEGTTFSICLPFSGSAIHGTEEKQPVVDLRGTETILVVDDEPQMLEVSTKLLQKQGYNVLSARNGRSALEIFRKRKTEIALVVLDYIMPEMDAGAVFVGLRDINPEVKVLIASGYSEEGGIADIIRAGAKGLVQKPFEIENLCVEIRGVIDGRV